MLFLGYGSGANGKSTLFNAIRSVLADYALNLPFSTLEHRQQTNIPNDLAMLPGMRFVTASETDEDTRLNEARVKALTGGDPITTKYLHREFFEFSPVMKVWLGVNHRPMVRHQPRVLAARPPDPLRAAVPEERLPEGGTRS